jgi:ATP adenylyltransferase
LSSEHLWAPWRLGYVKGTNPSVRAAEDAAWLAGADPACFLCRGVAENRDRDNLIVHRGEEVVTVLNRYPYNNGHLLVAPRRHKGTLSELGDAENLEIQKTIGRFVELLAQRMNAEAFNIGLNLGRVAGAGLPGHLHWHVVPRWHGDTNYMPVIAGVKVLPQSLDSLWELLVEQPP